MKTKLTIFLLMISVGLFSKEIPRPEYPNPQFERESWVNLNGQWTCEIDNSKVGIDRKYHESKSFSKKIIVPYCVESKLSGVEFKDFISQMWYHRKVTIPTSWKEKKTILHFGAVDFQTEVFVNGKSMGTNFGGTAPFNIDLSYWVKPGETFDLVVKVNDDLRSKTQMGGKQCLAADSRGCSYTRVTGIWQTVWLEAVNRTHIEDVQVMTDIDNSTVTFIPRFKALYLDCEFSIKIKKAKKVLVTKKLKAVNGLPIQVKIDNPTLWSLENPHLYDLEYSLVSKNNEELDKVDSYMGMRKIHYANNRFYLNNKPIFLRLVLDQGFYPDGVWTAPTDNDLKKDIEMSKSIGFNGARLHQKVFEPRFHYWADKLGYLTWGEASDWGMDWGKPMAAYNFQGDWKRIVKRDRNHPSIIAWTPFNESWKYSDNTNYRRFYKDVYEMTVSLDPTRLVNMASGGTFVDWTDIWTAHSYNQNAKSLHEQMQPDKNGKPKHTPFKKYPFDNQPYVLDEYGGVRCEAKSKSGWGYGKDPKTEKEFYKRLEDLTNALLKSKSVSGYTYTQLTDVEQETNGLFYYDRSNKFDLKKLNKVFSKDPEWLNK